MSSSSAPHRAPPAAGPDCTDSAAELPAAASAGLNQVFNHFDRGPVLVTFSPEAGQLWGLAASNFSLVSLDDPTILLSVGYAALPHGYLVQGGAFSAHCLGVDDENLVCAFAEPTGARAHLLAWRATPGQAPIVEEALLTLECRARSIVAAAGEMAVIASVSALRRGPLFERMTICSVSALPVAAGRLPT